MGLTAVSVCARNTLIPTDGFIDIHSRQHGDWHCVSILSIDNGETWNYPKQIAAMSADAVITACCVDSDFAEVSLYIGGNEIDSFTIGESYMGESIEPMYDLWKPFEAGSTTLQEFMEKNRSFIFAEQVLVSLREVFGFPLMIME